MPCLEIVKFPLQYVVSWHLAHSETIPETFILFYFQISSNRVAHEAEDVENLLSRDDWGHLADGNGASDTMPLILLHCYIQVIWPIQSTMGRFAFFMRKAYLKLCKMFDKIIGKILSET